MQKPVFLWPMCCQAVNLQHPLKFHPRIINHNFMRSIYTFLLMIGISWAAQAQNVPQFWKPVALRQQASEQLQRQTGAPANFDLVKLDFQALVSYLSNAPMEETEAAQKQALALDLPRPDGQMKRFWVVESPIIAPGLAERYPEIHTYLGKAADGSGTVVRFGVGYDGFHAYAYDPGNAEQSITQYEAGNKNLYMVFHNNDVLMPEAGFNCGVNDAPKSIGVDPNTNTLQQLVQARNPAAGITKKKYRIAIAAKAEYSIFHGGQVSVILSKITTALNYIVLLQERDFAVRLELVTNNDKLIFLDPDTDPYSGNETGDWMNQNQAAVNNAIGSSAYDIGHVFAVYVTGSATGIAGGRVCNVFGKARGCSSAQPPQGTYFNLVAAHEMCHQMSGSHTMSNCSDTNNGQLAPGNAYEPGSGSTIMGYPGACGVNDIQSNNDPYYHISNIEQVYNFVYVDEGKSCGTLDTTTNNPPSVQISVPNNISIPIGTPFKLTGSGSDFDGDALTYCWEQYNLGPTTLLGSPSGAAPSFRSYPPSTSPTRYFPRLQSVVSNNPEITEVLPTYTRDLSFRLTVRDNHAGAGAIASQLVNLKATAAAGPFLVLSPNAGGTIWRVGEQREVTWDVANTDKKPVNCQSVNIRLSTDGGSTFPIILASGVPNIGRACIQVPNNVGSTVRIMVEAADNVFFDVSNTNLTIQNTSTPAFTLCSDALNSQVCLPGNFSTTISTNSLGGYNGPIALDVANLPAGTTVDISPNPVLAGGTAKLTFNFDPNLAENVYNVTVNGAANGVASQTLALNFNVIQNNFAAFALISPAYGATGVDLGPVLKWKAVPDADSYQIQISPTPSFETSLLLAERSGILVDTFKIPFILADGQLIFWRVRPENSCNTAGWSDPYVFVTKVQSCNTYASNDLPKNITSNNSVTVESKIVVNANATLSDVNVANITGSHTFMKELDARLISPAGTEVLLWTNKCPGNYNFNFGFDDSAPSTFGCPPPTTGTFSKPAAPLSVLNGQNSNGTWTLRVKDNSPTNGGTLSAFSIVLCASQALNAPFLVNNNVLSLPSGSNEVIGTSLLKVDDADNNPGSLTYTIVTEPKYGQLQLDGVPLLAGDQFPQAAIDAGVLRYFDFGTGASDQFRFAVTDGNGGMVADIFHIKPIVATANPLNNIQFQLAPNPAADHAQLYFNYALPETAQVALYTPSGELVRNWIVGPGSTRLQMDLASVPAGMYLVSVQHKQAKGFQKLVVVR